MQDKHKKAIRTRTYILARIAGLVTILFLAIIFAIQLPAVQTMVARKAISIIEGKIDGKIDVGQIGVVPGIGLFIKDISVADAVRPDHDTLFRASSITADFSIKNLIVGYPKVKNLCITGGYMHLNSEDCVYKSNLGRIFKLMPKENPEPMGPETLFAVGVVSIKDFRFRLTNEKSNAKHNTFGFGMDWANLDATASDISITNLMLSDGRMSGRLNNITASTTAGFTLDHMECTAKVGRGQAMMTDVHIQDSCSNIHFEHLAMNYANAKAFQDFVNAVSMDARFERSLVSFKTIRYFAPSFENSQLVLDVSEGGTVVGPVSDMNVKNLKFKDLTEDVKGVVKSCRISYLPNVQAMTLDFKIDGVTFTGAAAGDFINNLSRNSKLSFSKYAPGEHLTLKATGKGTLNRLGVAGDLTGKGIGDAHFDILLRSILDKSQPISIGGSIDTKDLQVGTILANPQIGAASLNASLNATLEKKGIQVDLDSLKIGNFGFMGYNYSGISASGYMEGKNFEISAESSDPNASLTLLALKSQESLQTVANIMNVNLDKLGLLAKPSGINAIKGRIEADVPSLAKGNLKGKVLIKGLQMTSHGNLCDFGDIYINAEPLNGKQALTLSSQIARLSYMGAGRHMDIELALNDRKNIISNFIPGLYLARNTLLLFHSDDNGEAIGDISTPKVIFGKNSVSNLAFTFVNSENKVNARLGAEGLQCGEIFIKNPILNFDGAYVMPDDETYNISLDGEKTFIGFNDTRVGLGLDLASISKKAVKIKNFTLGNGYRNFKIDGGLSKSLADTMNVEINNVSLAIADLITGQDSEIDGIINTKASICSPMKSLAMNAEMALDSIFMRSTDIGSISLKLGFSDKALKFVATNTLNSKVLFESEGKVNTVLKEIEASARMRDFNVAAASPFLTDLFSEMSGHISGNIGARGPLKDLYIQSDSLRFDKTRLKLAFTNVPYTIDGKIDVSRDRISLDGITITDDQGGNGTLNGALTYEGPKSMNLNTKLALTNLMVLNTDYSSRNSGIYGKAYLGGLASINGPLGNLNLDVSVSPSQESQIFIPLSGSAAAQSTLLSFKQRVSEDDIAIKQEIKKKKTRKGGLKASIKFLANSALKAVVDINKSQGHRLDFQGEGLIRVDYNNNGLSLGGDYSITSGKYRFSVLNGVIMKDFNIQSGSSVKLNGSPQNISFDINALYKTKASLAPLTADTTSVSNRRLVNCGISISDRITNPKLKFSIDIPDLDPSTQSMVHSALNTEDKVQQQFMALLVTGCFIPTEQSGVTFNSNDAVFSNLSSIMSGQLNNILSRYNIPVDMGLNYTKNESGQNIFDVAVSTQLFNNRVLVNGSIGNRQKTNNSANVVGDIDIEVKIDKLGKYRVKAFSHSADDYTNFLDNTQRNGIGFSAQTEFNNLKQLWTNLFMSKKKKKEYILKQAQDAQNQKYKTIKIEK